LAYQPDLPGMESKKLLLQTSATSYSALSVAKQWWRRSVNLAIISLESTNVISSFFLFASYSVMTWLSTISSYNSLKKYFVAHFTFCMGIKYKSDSQVIIINCHTQSQYSKPEIISKCFVLCVTNVKFCRLQNAAVRISASSMV